MRRRRLLAAAALAPSARIGAAGATAAWPDGPVRLVVGFAPGGPADIVARVLAEPLSRAWSQPAVVENRGGAGGNLAAQQVARTRPDGMTALVTTSAFAVNPSLSRSAGYTPEEFLAAAVVAATPNLLVVRPEMEARTLQELIAYGRPAGAWVFDEIMREVGAAADVWTGTRLEAARHLLAGREALVAS